MFHSSTKNPPLSAHKKALKDLIRMISAPIILGDIKRQTVLKSMRELVELEDQRYASLCETLLKTFVNYVQLLPATSNSFYSQPGGLLDYALFRTEAALQLLKQFTVLESDGNLTEEQKLWQYALFSAALLQGVGKLYAEYHVELFDDQGNYLSIWNPLTGNLNGIGSYYEYQFGKNPEDSFRQRLTLLLAKAIMPVSGFNWIASNAEVLEVWLALLQEDQRQAGTLGAILNRADALAIQLYFNEMLLKRQMRARKPGTFHADLPESLTDKEQQIGFTFVLWLNKGLEDGRFVLNKAPLLMVPGGMLICADAYKEFVKEHPEFKNWLAVQKGFYSLNMHAINTDGSTNARFEQSPGNQVHSGDIFTKYPLALPPSVQIYNPVSGNTTTLSAIELVHIGQFNARFTRIQPLLEAQPLPLLSANGSWQSPGGPPNTAPTPGLMHRE